MKRSTWRTTIVVDAAHDASRDNCNGMVDACIAEALESMRWGGVAHVSRVGGAGLGHGVVVDVEVVGP